MKMFECVTPDKRYWAVEKYEVKKCEISNILKLSIPTNSYQWEWIFFLKKSSWKGLESFYVSENCYPGTSSSHTNFESLWHKYLFLFLWLLLRALFFFLIAFVIFSRGQKMLQPPPPPTPLVWKSERIVLRFIFLDSVCSKRLKIISLDIFKL